MSHQIYVRDPFGNMQVILSRFSRLEYARGESKVGYMYIDFEPSNINTNFFRVDARLEPWRQVGNNAPYLNGETVFFVRKSGFAVNASGADVFRVVAKDANYLCSGRRVLYASGKPQANKTEEIDNMMRAIMRENAGSLATDTARDLSPWLSVQVDLSAAPSTTKEFSYRKITDVFSELINKSIDMGTYLAYDIVYTSATTLEFRIYTGCRGIDHSRASANTVVVSREHRNLENAEFYEDHIDEFTHVSAGGQGIGDERIVKPASNAAAIGRSGYINRGGGSSRGRRGTLWLSCTQGFDREDCRH
jgi:hypothetical protein